MKNLILGLLAVGVITVSVTLAQEVMNRGLYSIKRTKQTKTLVTRIDVDAVRTNHLAKYELQQRTEDKSGRMGMVFYNKDSMQKIEVRTQLFLSVSDAENGVLDLLNSQSVIFTNGSPSGRAIGNKVWYFTTKETGATTIVFIRRNVVVSIFAREGALGGTLAEKLDADILAGNNGIELKDRQ